MTTLRAAAQQALEALEWHLERGAWGADIEGVTGALCAALAHEQPSPVPAPPRPVGWMDADGDLYRAKPNDNWNPPHIPVYTISEPVLEAWIEAVCPVYETEDPLVVLTANRYMREQQQGRDLAAEVSRLSDQMAELLFRVQELATDLKSASRSVPTKQAKEDVL